MKKHILIIFILFASNTIFAQIDKIVGNWSEIMRIQIDTTLSGIELMNKEGYEAYVKGYKQLSSEYTNREMMFPKDDDKFQFTIKKEGDYFVATNYNNISVKIINYGTEYEDYQINLRGLFSQLRICYVKYESRTDKLFFKDENSEIHYAFERKK
jgi:hypothetical protein